jgi:hypothetical protein
MGYQLVASAMQPEWGLVLTTTERLVLLIMCQAALDASEGGAPPRTYWGGTDLIVLQMRGDVPPRGSAEHRAAKETVRRALRKLEKVGAVQRSRIATNGMRAEYEITVHQSRLPVDNSPSEARSGPL